MNMPALSVRCYSRRLAFHGPDPPGNLESHEIEVVAVHHPDAFDKLVKFYSVDL